MSTKLSSRMDRFGASATVTLSARIAEIRAAGRSIISMNVGEPDQFTPENIKEAGIQAIKDNDTKYKVNMGIPELREAIAHKLKKDNNIDYSISEIAISVGAKQALMSSILAIVDEGDEVIIPVPCYLSYPDMVRFAGGIPVFPSLNPDDFSLNVDNIRDKVTDRTKAVIICSPNNPTGSVYSEESLRELAELALEKDFFVIADEIYEKLMYGPKHFSIASVSEAVKSHVITINGFSKSYAMTGWRIGYAAARADIIASINKIHSQQTTCVAGFIQKAAVEALTGPQNSVETMRKAFEERRDYCYNRLSAMTGVKCPKPDGAFYIFPDISGCLNDIISTDSAFCEYVLEEEGVAIMPGSAYEWPGSIRISFESSMEILIEAMDKLEAAIRKLS